MRHTTQPSDKQALIEQLYPMPNRPLGPRGKMDLAADVRRRDDVRLARLQGRDLVRAQLLRKLRLENRIGPCRAAAKMRITHRRELQSDRLEDFVDAPAELLSVLQAAWRVQRHALRPAIHRHLRREALPLRSD